MGRDRKSLPAQKFGTRSRDPQTNRRAARHRPEQGAHSMFKAVAHVDARRKIFLKKHRCDPGDLYELAPTPLLLR
ncbi:MAG: hypothetical protein ACO27F_09880 [Beijerinckiaceae bacterium]